MLRRVEFLLEEAGVSKAVVAEGAWVAGGVSDHDVVVEEDSQVLCGFAEVFGGLEVVFAGGGVPAGVVVHEDDGGGSVAHGWTKDFTWVNEGCVGGAGGDGLHADELVA